MKAPIARTSFVLIGICVLVRFAEGFHSIVEVGSDVAILFNLTLLAALLIWVRHDRAKDFGRNDIFKDMFDWGLVLAFSWPLLMPYYLVKTRRSRAALYIAVGVGIYVLPYFFGAMCAWLALLLTM